MKIIVRIHSMAGVNDEMLSGAGLVRGSTVVAPPHEGLGQALYHAVHGEVAASGGERWTADPNFSAAAPPLLAALESVQHVVCHGAVTDSDEAFLRKLRIRTRSLAAHSTDNQTFAEAMGMWTASQSGLMTMLAEAAFEGGEGHVFLVDVPDWSQLRDATTPEVRALLLQEAGIRANLLDTAVLLGHKLLERLQRLVHMAADLLENPEAALVPDLTIAVGDGTVDRHGLTRYRTWNYGDTWSDPASFRTTSEWMSEHLIERQPELGRGMLVWTDPVASQLLAASGHPLPPMDRLVCGLDEVDRIDGTVIRLADGQTPLELAMEAAGRPADPYLDIAVGAARLHYAWVDPRGSEFRRTAAAISTGMGRDPGDAVVRPEHSAKRQELVHQEQALAESARVLQYRLDAAVARLAEVQREHDDNMRDIAAADAIASESHLMDGARRQAMDRANRLLAQEEALTATVRAELKQVLAECERAGITPPQPPQPDRTGCMGCLQKLGRAAKAVGRAAGVGMRGAEALGSAALRAGSRATAAGTGVAAQTIGGMATAVAGRAAAITAMNAGTAALISTAAPGALATALATALAAAPGAVATFAAAAPGAVATFAAAAPGAVATAAITAINAGTAALTSTAAAAAAAPWIVARAAMQGLREAGRGILAAPGALGRAIPATASATVCGTGRALMASGRAIVGGPRAVAGAVGGAGTVLASLVTASGRAVGQHARAGVAGLMTNALRAAAVHNGFVNRIAGGRRALPAPQSGTSGKSVERQARFARKLASQAEANLTRAPKPQPLPAQAQARAAQATQAAQARAAQAQARAAQATQAAQARAAQARAAQAQAAQAWAQAAQAAQARAAQEAGQEAHPSRQVAAITKVPDAASTAKGNVAVPAPVAPLPTKPSAQVAPGKPARVGQSRRTTDSHIHRQQTVARYRTGSLLFT
jgi:hypothetical protein